MLNIGVVQCMSSRVRRCEIVSSVGEVAISEVHLKKLVGEEGGDLLGWSCAEHGGDFDGDGIGDIAIGARQADGYAVESGAVSCCLARSWGISYERRGRSTHGFQARFENCRQSTWATVWLQAAFCRRRRF